MIEQNRIIPVNSEGKLIVDIAHISQYSDEPFVTIFGYGSIMSTQSLKQSNNKFSNLRLGELIDYKRIFSLICPNQQKTGNSNWQTMEVAVLSVKQSQFDSVIGILVDIPLNDLQNFIQREYSYKIQEIMIKDLTSNQMVKAYVSCENNDEQMIKDKGREYYDELVNCLEIKQIWGIKNVLPVRMYLQFCISAAYAHGELCYDNFLKHTYLADEKVNIQEYSQKYKERVYGNNQSGDSQFALHKYI